MEYVITVCSNAYNEFCPVWPKKDKIIHWNIEDPVKKMTNVDSTMKAIEETYNIVTTKIKKLFNSQK